VSWVAAAAAAHERTGVERSSAALIFDRTLRVSQQLLSAVPAY